MMVADYAVGAARSLDALSRIATALDADIYSARFHVQGTVDPLHRNFRGQLPATTGEGNQILSRYHTMLLVGEKVDTFTYYGISALPGDLQVIQVAPATTQLGFDYPCEMAVLGDIRATLEAIAGELGAGVASDASRAREAPVAALEAKYPSSGKRPSDALILGVLRHLDLETHVITEGSSEGRDRAGYGGPARLPKRPFLAPRRRARLGDAPRRRHRARDRQARGLLRRGGWQPVFDPHDLDRCQVPNSRDLHLLHQPRVSASQGPLVPRNGNHDRDYEIHRNGLQRSGRGPPEDCGRPGRAHRQDQ